MRRLMRLALLLPVMLAGCAPFFIPDDGGSTDSGAPTMDAGSCSAANNGRTAMCTPPCGTAGVTVCLQDPATGAYGWSRCVPTGASMNTCMPVDLPVGTPCNAANDRFRVCSATTQTCVHAQACDPNTNTWTACQPVSVGCFPDAGADAAMTPVDASADAATMPTDTAADTMMMVDTATDAMVTMDVGPDASADVQTDTGTDATVMDSPIADTMVTADVAMDTSTDAARAFCPCPDPASIRACLDPCMNIGAMTCADYCAGSVICFPIFACAARPDAGTDASADVPSDTAVVDSAADVSSDQPDVVATDTGADVMPDAMMMVTDTMSDTGPDASADAVADTMADAAADASPDVVVDVMTDVRPDVVAEASADVATDVAADTSADVGSDVMDTGMDVVMTDASMDVMDAATDTVMEAAADVPVTGSFCDGAVGCNDLRIAVDPARIGACPTGWVIHLWDNLGFARLSAPGAALNWPVTPAWGGWAIMDIWCGAVKKDWSAMRGRTAFAAGVATITLGGVELANQTCVAQDPNHEADAGTQFIRPAIPVEARLRGFCPDATMPTP